MSDQPDRYPDFFMIGAAKSGTTSLFAILKNHPELCLPEIKEPEYFARDDLFEVTKNEYLNMFSAAKPGQLIGEASTIYTLAPFFPETAARIHAVRPQAKLIYVMRHPVVRAYSFYTQLIKNYQNCSGDHAVNRTFEEFIDPELHAQAVSRDKCLAAFDAHLPDDPELCLAGSDYVDQIKHYLNYFSRDQILFLKYEDFARDNQASIDAITDFLGISPIDVAAQADEDVRSNISSEHFDTVNESARLGRMASLLGPAWALRKRIPPSLRGQLRKLLLGALPASNDASPPPMAPAIWTQLYQRYSSQFAELEGLTGLDTSDWHSSFERAYSKPTQMPKTV